MPANPTTSRPDPAHLDGVRRFLDASPSQWHAAASAAGLLVDAGFRELPADGAWAGIPPLGFVRRGASVVAWAYVGDATADGTGDLPPLRIVGAHTDSPCLRIKPRPDTGAFGWQQLGVEVYGGVLLNSWLDRDLGVAGRVVLRDGAEHLLRLDGPIARVPQLAIHLDRDVNERGVVLDKHQHLTPVWGVGEVAHGDFEAFVAAALGVTPDLVAAWDLSLFDVTASALIGPSGDLLAAGRLDNQVSCWAAVNSLIDVSRHTGPASAGVAVAALFDHEEVGSESVSGAAGPVLEQTLERLALGSGADRGAFLAQLSRSSCVSADNAHSVHPNYPERHEANHRPLVNHGPAIKLNHNQRYATSATSSAMLQRVFETAGVPWQVFVSRNNVPCGTTIGPITATRLGIDTVDVGIPQLSMHSARELCGAHDPGWLSTAMTTYFGGAF
ncbi:MAG: M18 family aminopeptidase [Ilumatobacteraceae bacterium]